MGTQNVVDGRAPARNVGAEMLQAIAAYAWPNFTFQSAMEAFELALGLRMIGSAMAGADAQTDQAGLEPGESADTWVMIAEGVVAQEFVGQADFAEDVPQRIPGGQHGLVETGVDRRRGSVNGHRER